MMFKAIVLSALTSAIMAAPEPFAHIEVLQIRQMASSVSSMGSLPTDSAGLSACLPPSTILDIIESIPTPADDLLSAAGTITDLCHTPTFTGSLSAEWSSYTAQFLSWYSSNSAPLLSWESSLTKNCPIATQISVPTCSASSKSGSSSSGSGSSNSSNSSGSSGSSSSGAAGKTVVSIGAAAIAGLLGAVIML